MRAQSRRTASRCWSCSAYWPCRATKLLVPEVTYGMKYQPCSIREGCG